MGEFSVAGSELKKMLKLARKGPVSFGFSEGASDDDAYCGMHRLKPPAQLGKEAKEAADGGKFAFGTATVEGKVVSLTCERLIPGLAKKFKKYLKSQKVNLNVIILDADGNVVDSDVEEDLPDDSDLQDEEDVATQAAATEGPTAQPAPPLPEGVVARLGALAQKIRALPPEVAAQLGEALRKLLEFARAGEIERAIAGAGKLDAALQALEQRGAQAAAQPVPDPQSQKLRQAAAALRGKVEALADGKARSQLGAALDRADAQLAGNETEAAGALLQKIANLLREMANGRQGAAGPVPAGLVEKRKFLVERWAQLQADMKVELDRLCAALKELVPYERPDEIRAGVGKALQTLQDELFGRIHDAVDASINAGDQSYAGVGQAVAAVRTECAGNELLAALRENTLSGGAAFEKAMTTALDEIEARLTA